MAPMSDQNKKYAVFCAIAIVAGAAIGTMAFFGSEGSDAKDAPVRFAAKFQAAPMQRLRAFSPRSNALSSPAMMTKSQQKLLAGTGDSPMKRLALAAMSGRASDIKMQAEEMAEEDTEMAEELEIVKETVLEKAKKMAGITEPLGFFDPVGFCSEEGITEGKLCFYREVELKHGRVAMLASLGFVVGEQFHPLWGGNIDVPSYIAFQETPLQAFWPAVVTAIAVPEIFSVFDFQNPGGEDGQTWSMRTDRAPGDMGFDPLGLKPTDPEEFKEMQTKELNNGRLAMIASAGMVAQELATGQNLF